MDKNENIELLRLIAMVMVLILHIVASGGLLDACVAGTGSYYMTWFLRIAAYSAVDIFVLVSGYVGVNSKSYLSGIINLWLIVEFYSVIPMIIYLAIGGTVEKMLFIKAFLPVLSREFWFFTCYIVLMLFKPILNSFVNTKGVYAINAIVCCTILIQIAGVIASDTMEISGGHSIIWFLVLYLIGAYLSVTHCGDKVSKWIAKHWLWIYIVSVGITFASLVLIENSNMYFLTGVNGGTLLFNLVSPTVVLAAISIFLGVHDIKMNEGTKRTILFLSSNVFAVYLLHINYICFKNLWDGSFVWMAGLPVWLIPIVVICIAIVLCVGGCLVDKMRAFIFQKTHLNRIGKLIESFFAKIVNKFCIVD